MFKNFQTFNQWWNDHVPSELSLTLNRAISRVTALYQVLSSVVQDYTSAYNSVQTLGYSSEGDIEDQTSSDRLTVPSNVITKAINRLTSQYRALSNDRDSFVENFDPTDVVGLDWRSVMNTLNLSREMVIPLDGFGNLIIHDDYRGRLHLAKGVLDLLGRVSISDYPAGKYHSLPQIVFRETSSDQSKIPVCCYMSDAYFPQFLKSQSSIQWRMIAIGDLQTYANCSIVLDLKVNGMILSYKFRMTRNEWGYTADSNLPVTSLRFTDINSFRQFVTDEYSIVGSNLGSRTFQWSNNTLSLIDFNSYTSEQQTMFFNYFTDYFNSLNAQVVMSNTNDTLARIMFDQTTSLSPEDIQAAIVALRAGE